MYNVNNFIFIGFFMIKSMSIYVDDIIDTISINRRYDAAPTLTKNS